MRFLSFDHRRERRYVVCISSARIPIKTSVYLQIQNTTLYKYNLTLNILCNFSFLEKSVAD